MNVIDLLLVATKNSGKAREFEHMLRPVVARVEHLAGFSDVPTAPEDASTFAGNARAKALYYQKWLAAQGVYRWCLADDSGLQVDALGGRPGVYSARYAGEGVSDSENVELLLHELSEVDEASRAARFVCALALVDPDGVLRCEVRGVCEGRISSEPRGQDGFGYDPVFIPEGHAQTFGEHPELKRELSHRAAALESLLVRLRGEVG